MLNTITVMGRLTSDPELRYTQSNTPVANFTVACERDFNKEAQAKDVDFIDCVAWRSTGEFVSKYFQKGSMIVAQGRLQIRKWKDSTDYQHQKAEIIVGNVYFGEQKRREAQPETQTPWGPEEDVDDGDLPF